MARLPFVVEPKRKPIIERIGTEESGLVEIERYGYLTTGEKSFVQQVQQFDNGSTEIITVSRLVARKFALGMDRAYQLVVAIISGSQVKQEDQELVNQIEEEFADHLTGVIKGLTAGQAREELVFAACLIRYRIDPSFEVDQVSKVHPDIITGLANLYREEEARSVKAFEQAEGKPKDRTVEENEKKQVKSNSSHSRTTTGI
jgi:hypothetical protein